MNKWSKCEESSWNVDKWQSIHCLEGSSRTEDEWRYCETDFDQRSEHDESVRKNGIKTSKWQADRLWIHEITILVHLPEFDVCK